MKNTAADKPIDIALECQAIHHWFGRKRVLAEVDLQLARGQFMALVGPSGCGKSTLLRAIVGTHLPHQGKVVIISPPPARVANEISGPGRDRGIVYQHYSLFPFLTAQHNVALGLLLDQTTIPFRLFSFPKWRKLRKQHLEQAAEVLHRMKLSDAMHLYPHEMSGGMRQRVAIAQALIMKPEVILLDEPFGALDESTREDLQKMLLGLYAENEAAKVKNEKPPYTLIIVTHELNEAIYVGDRVVGLSQFWNWKEAGHETFPGATVVYDKPSHAHKPENTRDFLQFAEQREEIRRVVFEPSGKGVRNSHITYWESMAARRPVL